MGRTRGGACDAHFAPTPYDLTGASHSAPRVRAWAQIGTPANADVQAEIARDGGIPPLLNLLNCMNVDAQVHAAEALANLAQGNPQNQDMVAKAGGIKPLLVLLQHKSLQAQAHGASALAQLATNNPANQDAIALDGGLPLLRELLGSTSAVQKMTGFAITETCRDNPQNQTAAAECGTINALVEQLKDTKSSEEWEAVKAESGARPIYATHHGHAQRPRDMCPRAYVPRTSPMVALRPSHASYLPPPPLPSLRPFSLPSPPLYSPPTPSRLLSTQPPPPPL